MGLNDYELIYIVSPKVDEEHLTAVVEKVSKSVTDRGGTVEKIDQWGKKRLAYPIKHFNEGNYISAKIKLSPKSTAEMEANLQINEDVIRHLLVKAGE